MAVVLLCGCCLTFSLISSADTAQAARQIKTAKTEAAETKAAARMMSASKAPRPSESAKPSNVSGELSAQGLQTLVFLRETRRETIIPVIDTVVIHDATTWKEIKPEDDSIKAAAYEKSAQTAKYLFGYEMNDDYSFSYYTDTSKHRPDFVQVKTSDNAIICTLKADTLELINIDYDFIPKGEQTDTQLIADKIAGMFGVNAPHIVSAQGGDGNEVAWNVYSAIADGRFINLGVVNGELYAVSVYPSEASMREYVYFDADVQFDPSIVYLASPRSFTEGEPGEDDMTRDEAQNMYLSFLNLANGDGNYQNPTMTFYIDHSGTREDYWHLKSDILTMDIASESKWIISLTCDRLWNPEHDLTGIEYTSMGGEEYADYVRHVMSNLYGDGLVKVGVNAVYDYHFCTEDAWMADGTVYEFMFADGKLTKVEYYFDKAHFGSVPPCWKADSVYVNSTTGEKFIPQ